MGSGRNSLTPLMIAKTASGDWTISSSIYVIAIVMFALWCCRCWGDAPKGDRHPMMTPSRTT
jgi:hypothetical protein